MSNQAIFLDWVQFGLTLLGGFIALLWWLTRRERFPRGNIDASLDHVDLGENGHLLRVGVFVHNIGHVIIRLSKVRIYLQQIEPVPLQGSENGAVPFDFSMSQDSFELNWPALVCLDETFERKNRPEFEPNETGPIFFDFRFEEIPNIVNVYVHLENEAKGGWNRWLRRKSGRKPVPGWTLSKIIHLKHEHKTTTTTAAP